MKGFIVYCLTLLTYILPAQETDIPLITSDKLNLDIMVFKPNRAIYKDLYFARGTEELNGYIFIHLDQVQMWTKPNLMIQWGREGVGATAFDLVLTDHELAIKHRQMPSRGYPNGVILENHYYGDRADIMFTSPNQTITTDTSTFRYAKKNETYVFNELYTYEKKFNNSHNVIIWPYLMSMIDWEKYPDLIMPGFSPLGIQEYYYRMIRGEEISISDDKNGTYEGFVVTAIRTDDLQKLRQARLMDPIPKTRYFVSTRPPYYLGKEVLTYDSDGREKLSRSEVFIGYDLLEYSFGKYLEEVMEMSKEFLEGFEMPWNEK